jgi:hypothetical protein
MNTVLTEPGYIARWIVLPTVHPIQFAASPARSTGQPYYAIIQMVRGPLQTAPTRNR